MYKTILVPVDVYETALSDKALQHAQFLAQSASGNVHLLYVMPKFSAELTAVLLQTRERWMNI